MIQAALNALTPEAVAHLHPIERDLVAALHARPLQAWCRAQRQMLFALLAKAKVKVKDPVSHV